MVFQSHTASRIQNCIVCDLLWTWYKCLTQTAPFIIKLVDGGFDCSFSTNSGKFDHLKIDRFYCISKEYMKSIYMYDNILYKQIIVIYNVDRLPQKNIWE